MKSLRKTLLPESKPSQTTARPALADFTSFELTSEQPEYPLENAFEPGPAQWRANDEGMQTIRLFFDTPQSISRVWFVFEERAHARTQEFVLLARSADDSNWRPVVRQQFNFSPPGTTCEREEYQVNLKQVSALELSINPGVGRASLTYFSFSS